MSEEHTRYDAFRYPSKAYNYAHIDRLYVVGLLFGMTPPAVQTARVLEIGCGEGTHLIAMAHHLPDATFVGIDLAPTAIEAAKDRAAKLGLDNVTFEVTDAASIPESLGPFDYIVCHGVFSWVPEEAQQGILQTIRRTLTPHGVAYVSYNVYPGWHLHNVARSIMQVHAENFESPEQQVEQAVAFVSFLGQQLEESKSAYGAVLRREAELMGKHNDGYLFHDFLSPDNKPFLFRDFVRAAEGHELQYLGDSVFGDMLPTALPETARKTLEGVSRDVVSLEQYLDFYRGTGFRRSLLVHAEQTLDRRIDGKVVAGLHATMRGTPVPGETDLTNWAPFELEAINGNTVRVTEPLAKAAMVRLIERFPGEYQAAELTRDARALMKTDAEDTDMRKVGAGLVHAFGATLVDLAPRQRMGATSVSERPEADGLARLQALDGERNATNLRHEQVMIDRLARRLLILCDGSRDLPAIVEGCIEAVGVGELSVKIDEEEITEPRELRKIFTDAIPHTLNKLVRSALFVG
jgi:SAM-dependent methyltransferase